MKTLLALLILIPSLSWGNDVWYCVSDEIYEFPNPENKIWNPDKKFKLMIDQSNQTLNFDSDIFGTKDFPIINSYGDIITAHHFNGRNYIYFDAVEGRFSYTLTDFTVWVYMASCSQF